MYMRKSMLALPERLRREQAYASHYTGLGRTARLQFIAKQASGSQLELDALKMAADELKKVSQHRSSWPEAICAQQVPVFAGTALAPSMPTCDTSVSCPHSWRSHDCAGLRHLTAACVQGMNVVQYEEVMGQIRGRLGAGYAADE